MSAATLVLGGARSGKSAHAERIALGTRLAPVYVATAQAFDDEMRTRIARHRSDRAGGGWRTIEEPIDLPGAIREASTAETVILVDCLTLWLSNLMLGGHDVASAQADLLGTIDLAAGPLVLVSNEVGLGIVPETPLGRDFRDAQGRLNQAVAAAVPHVVFIAAGLPLVLKPGAEP